MMEITPLENWAARKIGKDLPLDRQKIESYQLNQLKQTLIWAKEKSQFYREHLKNIEPAALESIKDISNLPFTSSEDLRKDPRQFLCIHPDDIKRIVTLPTSGTTGTPKRIFFTKADQELTIDFFHLGMTTFVSQGDKVLILLPGHTPGSVGDLLRIGLEREGITGIVHGPVPINDIPAVVELIANENITSIVGIPVQVLALARYNKEINPIQLPIKSVLLSTDFAPKSIARAIENIWNCKVFDHYGMTEMGLGGGVECWARNGYHLREADLLFEIIDPKTGKPVPDGEFGEVVFTTLTRKGMPLIRYRTGDVSRFITEPCPCKSALKRLERVLYRLDGIKKLPNGQILTIGMLDEAIFSIENVINYKAQLIIKAGRECLYVIVYSFPNLKIDVSKVYLALNNIPAVNEAILQNKLTIYVEQITDLDIDTNTGTAKRTIEDFRNWR